MSEPDPRAKDATRGRPSDMRAAYVKSGGIVASCSLWFLVASGVGG